MSPPAYEYVRQLESESDSRNRIRSAELVLLDLASYVEDHNGDRYLTSVVIVIADELSIRGNIHFDQVEELVYCMPDRAAAAGWIDHWAPLDLLHLSISLCDGTKSC